MKTRVRALALMAPLLLAAPGIFASDNAPYPDAGYVTRVLATEYPYVPSPVKTAAIVSGTGTASVDIAGETPGEYRNRARIRRLSEAIARQEDDARLADNARALGIGVRAIPVGRHFAAGVITVFYIPIWIAAGFSW